MSERDEKRALIIEDEPVISKMCQRVLSLEGFTVTSVDNGQDAEKAAAS
ncbi:MAG: hypothetical protein JW712_12940 [Dehalococcoidales bacterium]|nr:hypothetical protein [Dehalococcoidales bacterium]